MNWKNIGSGLFITGIIILTLSALYELFKATDVPIIIKLGIGLLIIGIAVVIPPMIKEAKKDKVKIK